MNTHLTNRLAAQAGTRAAELIVHADQAGAVARRVINATWKSLWESMPEGRSESFSRHKTNYHWALRTLDDLPRAILITLREQIERLLMWAHRKAAAAMLATLPKAYLRTALAVKVAESRAAGGELPHGAGRVRLLEAGAITFGLSFPADLTSGQPIFTSETPLSLTPAQELDAWRDLLFPPPSADDVKTILDRLLPPSWTQGVFDFSGSGVSAPSPQSLATTIAQQYAAGKSTQDVAREIRPFFDGSAMRAERTARTLGAYVGTERNLATSEALGDLVMGYQVHSAGGENARHDHAMRSGTVYYREPKPGQFGMDVLPHPPVDTGNGPEEDGGGTKYNCRCWITPVLAPLPAMQSAAFTDNAHKLIPDPSHFADWFADATESQKKAAAGVRRLSTARATLGREPTWADLVDAKSGKLLAAGKIAGETAAARVARVAKVNRKIDQNRAAIQKAAAYGTV